MTNNEPLKPRVPECHFKPMEYVVADDWPNGQVAFWECAYCGHTKEIDRIPTGY